MSAAKKPAHTPVIQVGLFKIPMTPNFILTDGGPIPVQELDEATLKAIGKTWTANLLLKARRRREAGHGD